ncbi:MAG: energy-coupling factor transporter transmembrane component T [Bacillota bacterium]
MRNLDPRSKLCLVAVLSSFAVLYRDVFVLGILFFVAVLIGQLSGVQLSFIWKKMKRFLQPLLFIIIIQSMFTTGGQPLLHIGEFTILSEFGLIRGLEFLLRMGIIIVLGFFLSTSSQREIAEGLLALKIPYELAFMATLGAKFIPIFSEEFVDSLNALMFRGIDLQKLSLPKKIKVYTYILTPVVSNSILRGKELAIAMELRGFRLNNSRTNFYQLQLQPRDYATMILSFVVCVVGIIWRFL